MSGIGDAAVRARTGRNWVEWFRELDAADARNRDHKGIVAILTRRHGDRVSGWWRQMITVAYERARWKRVRHETPGGFQISASRTIASPVGDLYGAWSDPRQARGWLAGGRFTIRKATPRKSMWLNWKDGPTRLDIHFYPKGRVKSQVTVNHTKLASAAEAPRMKIYWGDRLGRLKRSLEKPGA